MMMRIMRGNYERGDQFNDKDDHNDDHNEYNF